MHAISLMYPESHSLLTCDSFNNSTANMALCFFPDLTIEFRGKASVKFASTGLMFRRKKADPFNVDEEHYMNQCLCLYSRGKHHSVTFTSAMQLRISR